MAIILTEDDLSCSFEKIFLFEFFIRNLQFNQKQEFKNLLQLKECLQKNIINLNISCNIDDVVHLAINYIEFHCHSYAQKYLENLDVPDKDIAEILGVFEEFRRTTQINLVNKFYRLSDLAFGNDIPEIIDWWSNNIDDETRDKGKLCGKFGAVGMGGPSSVVPTALIGPHRAVERSTIWGRSLTVTVFILRLAVLTGY